MSSVLPIEALMQAARKRKLLDEAMGRRVSEWAASRDTTTPDAVRRWLETDSRLDAAVADALASLLPPLGRAPFGAYQPLAHLADGGMGSVWLAASADHRLVVVKTMRGNPAIAAEHYHIDEDGSMWLEDPLEPVGTNTATQPSERKRKGESSGGDLNKRFEREALIMRKLAHPHVVRCLDHGVATDGTLYMVLEFIENGDLKELVTACGPLSEALALNLAWQVVDGLAAAHRLHLIHRDIKPPNIFITEEGRVRVADFGFARSTHANRTQLTMQGTMLGSPLYMSPEQITNSGELDIRCDLYAVGAVLYFCLAGKPPYLGSVAEVLHQQCTAAVPDIRKLRPEVSTATADIITRCMQKQPAERYRDPEELRTVLGDALQHLGMAPGASIALPAPLVAAAVVPQAEFATVQMNLASATEHLASAAAVAAGAAGAHRAMPAPALRAPIAAAAEATTASGATISPTADGGALTTIVARRASVPADWTPDAVPGARLAEAPPRGETVAVPSSSLATMAVTADPQFLSALGGDWVSLIAAQPGDASMVMLYARSQVRLGKLRDPSVDICLRNYPVETHMAACQRISRQHLALRFDPVRGQALVQDLGAANGTSLNGAPISQGQLWELQAEQDYLIDFARVVTLRARCLRRRDPPAGGNAQVFGVDAPHTLDAVVLTRPLNRPELAYAVVLRRLTIGGPGADLVLPGARTLARCEVGLIAGRWAWRASDAEPWRALSEGTLLDCGGVLLRARPGSHEQY